MRLAILAAAVVAWAAIAVWVGISLCIAGNDADEPEFPEDKFDWSMRILFSLTWPMWSFFFGIALIAESGIEAVRKAGRS